MQERTVLLFGPQDRDWMGIRSTLDLISGVHVVADTDDPEKAVELAVSFQPDVVFAAPQIADDATLSALRAIGERSRQTRCIIIAHQFGPWETYQFTLVGVTSFLLWRDFDPLRLRDTLTTLIFQDGFSLSSTRVRNAFIRAIQERLQPDAGGVSLSERERRILRHLMDGLTREQIAMADGVSLRTVKRTLACLEEKLDAPSQFALGVKAARLGLIA